MESRVEGVESSLSSVQHQLQDHGVLLKEHGVELGSMKEVLDRLVTAQGRVADELASLREGALGGLGSHRRLPGEGSAVTGGGSSSRGVDCGETQSEFQPRKIELPVFVGDDPDEWTYRAERYFGLQRLSSTEQLEAAVLCLEGAALNWFRWENQRRLITTWEELKLLLLRRFRPVGEGSVYDRFFVLQQVNSVQEYRRKFEALAASMETMGEAALRAAFLKGLKVEIQAPLRVLEPNGLIHMMELAEQLEATQALTKGLRTGPAGPVRSSPRPPLGTLSIPDVHSKGTFVLSPSSSSTSTSTITSPKPVTAPAQTSTYRCLSEAKIQEKKRRGVCFKCDGRWTRGHECSQAEVQVILIQDDAMEDSATDPLGAALGVTESAGDAEAQLVEVSLNAVVGLTSPKTMKILGSILGHEVVVLVDSGATHNFITTELAQKLALPVSETETYGAQMGSGNAVKGAGVCRSVHLQLQGIEIVEDFPPLQLGSTDVILGVQWLETLGETTHHWKEHTMKLRVRGQPIVLHGDPLLHKTCISLKQMIRLLQNEKHGMWVKLGCTEVSQLFAVYAEGVKQVLQRFRNVFDTPSSLPPPQRRHDHAIILQPDAAPVSIRPYRYPHGIKDEVEKLVQEMLRTGVIQPSTSPFSSPILLVKKKDGGWRFCVDYRALNRATVPDKFPIPVIDELIDELHGAQVFSKLDLRSGFHQIRVRQEDIHKTAFRTHEGHYEFVVMPFGLTNAPATFQSQMNDIFRPHLRKRVLVFFDDILVYSPDEQTHVKDREIVLQTLSNHQFFANLKKCCFGQRQVEYLGHIISGAGVAVDPSKIQSMVDWPLPRTLKELRGFLGLTGYYRKFVKHYGEIARPLTEQLKKDQFKWNEAATIAFEELKKRLTTVPVLAMPDFTKPFIEETDASGFGIGAVLMQEGRPLAYFSQVLKAKARLKSIYEKELMAIVLAVLKWRPYLLGRRFIVRTNQKSFKFLLEQRLVTPEHQKWLVKLLGYDFEIHYRPGETNRAADALSRVNQVECALLTSTTWLDWGLVHREITADPFLSRIQRELEQGKQIAGFSLSQQRLLYKGRLILSSSSALLPHFLREYHCSSIGGHSGELRTYHRLKGDVYWVGMKAKILEFVRSCDVCQRNKYLAMSPGDYYSLFRCRHRFGRN
ncbi:uncharacterized protein LOC133806828 [Humulus lupulus]|uniref:uncharacterized protein LOC133806828 n=1 Tax=Humulus lupulus TaxID=3486 RepID=UPI002B41172B|nr:uncharacterized protein LOC133806828 [Humulus lupulus]